MVVVRGKEGKREKEGKARDEVGRGFRFPSRVSCRGTGTPFRRVRVRDAAELSRESDSDAEPISLASYPLLPGFNFELLLYYGFRRAHDLNLRL